MRETDTLVKSQDVQLVTLELASSDTLDAFFTMKFANGKQHNVRLHEQKFYASEDLYGIAKAPSCAILDIVLAKGGPEAIAESYYSAVRAQMKLLLEEQS